MSDDQRIRKAAAVCGLPEPMIERLIQAYDMLPDVITVKVSRQQAEEFHKYTPPDGWRLT